MMRISHKKKFIFLANPRAASTTVRTILDPYSDVSSKLISEVDKNFPFYHHITALELKRIFDERGWDWGSYKTFCVIRNPYDRIVSLYHHQQRIYAEIDSLSSYHEAIRKYGFFHASKMIALFILRPKSFAEFVRRIDTSKSLTTSIKNFAFDDEGNQLVDKIIKFEDLSTELPKLLKKLDINVTEEQIPKLNSAKRTKLVVEFYTEEDIVLMQKYFGYEIERFSYEP